MKMVDSNEESKSVVVKPKPQIVESNGDCFPVDGIPSNYKLYPEGTQILGRRLTVSEVKRLAELNNENFNFLIKDTLKNVIKGIDVNEIKIQDQMYIILWLRANTYKEAGYESEFFCDNCESVMKHEFQLEDLKLISLKDDFKGMLTLGTDVIEINFTSISDSEAANNLKDKDKDILSLASEIGSINGENKSLLEKYNFIENMDPCNYAKLNSYINKYQFGFEPNLDIECPNCKELAQIGVSFRPSFFIPEYRY